MTCRIKNGLIKVMLFICLLSFALGVQSIFGVTVKATDSSIISMTAGASVNVTSSENAGLRFQAKVDKTAYDTLAATVGVTKVELGMMTVPTDMVKDAANNGKAFTIEGLSSYTPLDGYDYYSIATEIVTVGDYYYFKMTIPGISEKNYNRDFSARAFIKVTATALDDPEFALYDGAYYSYAPYNEEDNARCVYEVAYKTYVDRTDDYDAEHQNELNDGTYGVVSDEGLAIAKTFIDGVAVVENNNGTIEIANNHEYYTSPYTVEKNGDYCVVSADPAGLTYNGARCKNLYAVDGKKMVSTLVSSGATLGDNNAVTLACKGVSGAAFVSYALDAIMDNKYIAYAGEYGANTYIDFAFTGNNMPSVMFFADEINGNMSGYSGYTGTTTSAVGIPSGEKGIVVTNGFTGTNPSNAGYDIFQVWGPNRIYTSGGIKGAFSAITGNAIIKKTYGADTDFNALTQKGLTTDYANTNFKYTLGIYDNQGALALDVTLIDLDNQTTVVSEKISLGISTSSMTAGNIVVYSTVKGSANHTEFTTSNPYYFEPDLTGVIYTNKATVDENNSVTIEGLKVAAAGYTSQMTAAEGCGYMDLNVGYVGLGGKYGIGTFIDVTYTGNNMPSILFFADRINSDITQGGGKGVLLASGILCNSTWRGDTQLGVYGPNRIPAQYDVKGGLTVGHKTYGYTYGSAPIIGSVAYANYPLLTTKGLIEDASNATYKLTVGTLVSDTGKLIIDIYLYSVTADEVVYDVQIETSLSAGEVEAGSIVLYGAIKGSDSPTTFSYGEPYMSEDFSENILSFETTNSVTFTAKNGGSAEISTDKAFQGARSLKVSALSQVTSFNLYGFKPLDGYNKNDLVSVNAYVYLDASAGATLLLTDKNGNAYTYLDAAQTAVSAGAWTSVTVDIPVGYDDAKYLDVSFKVVGADALSAVSVYVDNVQIQYNSLLGYSLYSTQAGLGGNTVYMLPCATTNQNMSFIVVNSDGQIIMIDGGYEADAQNIINMVKALQPGVEKPVITAWLLTHGHIDHISAISTVLNSREVTVNAVYHDIPSEDAWATAKTAGYDNGSGDTDATARTNLYTALESAGLTAIRPQTGVSLTFGSATFDILYTPTDNGTFTSNYGNNTSVIYKLNTTEKDVLFLGDAGTDLGAWLLENKAEELKSDIVQMAHHGQNGVRQPVYQAIAPSIALWPTPDWVWSNRDGMGTLETLTVRGWMEELGTTNYVSKDGIIKLI